MPVIGTATHENVLHASRTLHDKIIGQEKDRGTVWIVSPVFGT